jgi:peptide/nickel transport system substrate-binding protein
MARPFDSLRSLRAGCAGTLPATNWIRPSIAALVFVAAGVWAGCGGGQSAPPKTAAPAVRAIVASIRAEPRTFNRFVARDSTTETIAFLTQAKLVRVNRTTQDVEPWLAESWTPSADGLSWTLKLRRGVRFSDGSPFTSADVLFSLKAAYDEKTGSSIGEALTVDGKPLVATATDDTTVVVKFPAKFGPGVRLLDNLPVMSHARLEAALAAGTFAKAWDATTPAAEMCGLGPFVLKEYVPGVRLIFERNPHYWRTDAAGRKLPYLDRVTLEIVPDQNAELLRLQTGQIDCTQSETRPEDYTTLKRVEAQGKIRLIDLGVGLDADSLWFNLKKDGRRADPRWPWMQSAAFRKAVSHAVDRAAFADTVFLGAGVPVNGPVSPANKLWHSDAVTGEAYDQAQARTLLGGLGLADRDGDHVLEDRGRRDVRFTLLTQKGNSALERGAAVIRTSLEAVGIKVDVVPLENGALIDHLERGDYDAMYFRLLITDMDPAMTLDFWLSSGGAHVWNRGQAKPTTDWEREIDRLITEQAETMDPAARKQVFDKVQTLFAEQLPVIYFAAPRVFVATSTRLDNTSPALLRPMILWNADTLTVK